MIKFSLLPEKKKENGLLQIFTKKLKVFPNLFIFMCMIKGIKSSHLVLKSYYLQTWHMTLGARIQYNRNVLSTRINFTYIFSAMSPMTADASESGKLLAGNRQMCKKYDFT